MLIKIGTADYLGGSYNLIYDNASPFGPIVWLDYTHSLDYNYKQVGWAISLNDALQPVNYHLNAGITMNWGGGWRLPETVDGPYAFGYDGTTTAGYNITTSELGHLYYDQTALWNKGYCDTSNNFQPGYGLTNTGDFQHLAAYLYWSGTKAAFYPDYAWFFSTLEGYQSATYNYSFSFYALAVRPGQVESAAVPEPSTIFLLGAGLGGLALLRRKSHK